MVSGMEEGRPSVTARWVARNRARLSSTRPARGDAAAEDRLYADLAGRFPAPSLAGPAGMAARTQFFDAQFVAAFDRGIDQVVILGAGYDGRALRFSAAGARWIEVDYPSTQADKRSRLARIGAVTDHIAFVALDLLGGGLGPALTEAGHSTDRPTLWISEGVFPYLPEADIVGLCRTIAAVSAPGSRLLANVLVAGPPTAQSRAIRRLVDAILAVMGEHRRSEFRPGAVDALVSGAGWTIIDRQSSVPGRADGSYMFGFAAEPSPGQ